MATRDCICCVSKLVSVCMYHYSSASKLSRSNWLWDLCSLATPQRETKSERSRLLTTDHRCTIVSCLIIWEVLLCYMITIICGNAGACTLQYSPGLFFMPGVEANVSHTSPQEERPQWCNKAFNYHASIQIFYVDVHCKYIIYDVNHHIHFKATCTCITQPLKMY